MPPQPNSSSPCKDGWKEGDGSGGTEKALGDTNSTTECIMLAKRECPTANGATIAKKRTRIVQIEPDGQPKLTYGKLACYCEMNMTSINVNHAWQTCFFA
jgi:hypothetical protein